MYSLKMKYAFAIAFLICFRQGFGQSITLQGNATFWLGGKATFYAGANAAFEGRFTNNGTIISNRDLDVKGNSRMAGLRFVGNNDQVLKADDTLRVKSLTMSKELALNLDMDRLIVEDSLEIISGVLGAGSDTTLLVSGEIIGGSDDGFIEGKVVHLAKTDQVSFPLGLNGFYNAITIDNVPENTVIVVEARLPDPDRLKPTDEMVGISDEVEWVITTPGDPIEIQASAIFNGIDLVEFSNGQPIRAQGYSPTLVKFGSQDTAYIDLGIQRLVDTDSLTFGNIVSNQTFQISERPTYLGIALIPRLASPIFFIPNAFSPNSSFSENRVFQPFFAGKEVSFISLKVWDKFQRNVHFFSDSGDDLDLSISSWDGTLSNGEIADVGVYYFSVSLIADGERYDKTGAFLLAN